MSNVIPLRPRRRPPADTPPPQTPTEEVEQIALSLLRVARDAPGAPKLRAAMLRVFGAEDAAALHDDLALIAKAAATGAEEQDVSPIETAMLHALAQAQRAERDAPAAAKDDVGAAVARIAAALSARDLHLPDQTQPDAKRPANDFRRPTIHTTRLTSPQMLLIQGVRFSVEQLLDGSEDYAELSRAYEAHGLDYAADALFGLSRIIGRTASRPVMVHCFVCPSVSGDEQALIEAVGALQLGDRETARAIFDEFLPPIASQFAVEPASGVARAFAAAGYRLA